MNNDNIQAIRRAVHETIVAAGDAGIPNGHLYAALMEKGCSFDLYQLMIETLKGLGYITERGNVLRGTTA